MNFPILSVIAFVPLLGSVIVLLMPKDKERLIKQFAIAISFIPLILSILLWIQFDKSAGMQFEEQLAWIPSIHVNYHVGADGLSVPLVFLTAFLTTLSLFYSSFTIKTRVKEFFLLFLLLEMGMMGVFISLDFVLFYVFWEIGLVPMYFLIGVWGGPRREYAAIKFFLYTLVGSVAMLLAIIAIYLNTGTFDLLQAAAIRPFVENVTLGALAFWAIFLAFAIKVPMFPFHTWLPDAHVEAPTAGSVILAGILLKLGCYGFLRVLLPMFPEQFRTFAPVIAILAIISIVYGAMVSMAQWDLKKLIAYSSVSHMGYVMLGVAAAAFAIGNAEMFDSQAIALNGAVFQMFNHGIITGALFFLVGIIYERAHTRDLKAFGGLASKVPYYYGIMLVTGLASLGLPGLAGFWGEFFVFRGAFAIAPVWAAIGAIGIVFTAAYILWKVIQHVFLGPFNETKWAGLVDMTGWEKVTLWPLVIFMLLFGLFPPLIVNTINAAMTQLLGKL